MEERIPHYKNDPEINAKTAPELKLYRPEIHYRKAVIFVIGHFVFSLIIVFIWTFVFEKDNPKPIIDLFQRFWIILSVAFFLTLRFSFIWFVRLYQHYAKSETRLKCCMTPSCSEYAILAFKKYGALLGGFKTYKRLLRCHPPGGIDYP